MENKQKRKYSQPMAFVVLFGIVSLFSDMTHEGASSIRGAYLTLLGASAGTIGFISGLGELVGYSMRYVFGKLTDKTKHYWTMTIVGYVLDVLAVPALALVGEHGWVWACALLVIQRMGKAVKKPAKDTILSFAASQEGVGKSFGIQEVLDQIGAFLGPALLYLVMLFQSDGTTFQVYSTCFAVLAIPGAITLVLLVGAPFLIGTFLGAMPDMGAVAKGFLSVGLVWTVSSVAEFLIYTPMLGAGGGYLAFITGNLINMKIPCAVNARDIVGTISCFKHRCVIPL